MQSDTDRQLRLCRTRLRIFEQNLEAIRHQQMETERRIILLKKEIEQLVGDKNV